jgi:hypothetical protein
VRQSRIFGLPTKLLRSPCSSCKRSFSARVAYEEALKNAQNAWGVAATQLLKRYGIEKTPEFHPEPWANTLGELRPQDWRGTLLVIALHATGWSGLMALYFAPELRTWAFRIFCIFLIGYGLLHDWQVARNFNNPLSQWTILLRSVLAELKKPRKGDHADENSEAPVQE